MALHLDHLAALIELRVARSCAFSPFRRRLRASATATTAGIVPPDRRRLRELAAPGKLLRDIPRHSTVVRRVEEGPLQTRHRPIDGALPPTGDARERVFGSAAESYSVWRGERASKVGNDLLGIDMRLPRQMPGPAGLSFGLNPNLAQGMRIGRRLGYERPHIYDRRP
jgi:hypothetical protein